jgi:hypothetical protein
MKKKNCPLTPTDWVNYLMQEQNEYYFKFYNEVIYKFTIAIVVLTILNCFLVLETILFDFISIDSSYKFFIFLISILILIGVIIFMLWVLLKKLPSSKEYHEKIIKHNNKIIGDILHGREKDSDSVLKRYEEKW